MAIARKYRALTNYSFITSTKTMYLTVDSMNQEKVIHSLLTKIPVFDPEIDKVIKRIVTNSDIRDTTYTRIGKVFAPIEETITMRTPQGGDEMLQGTLSEATQEKYDIVIDKLNELGLDEVTVALLIEDIDSLVDFALTEGDDYDY